MLMLQAQAQQSQLKQLQVLMQLMLQLVLSRHQRVSATQQGLKMMSTVYLQGGMGYHPPLRRLLPRSLHTTGKRTAAYDFPVHDTAWRQTAKLYTSNPRRRTMLPAVLVTAE